MIKYNAKELEQALLGCSYEEYKKIREEVSADERKVIQNLLMKTERRFLKEFKKLEDYKKRRAYEDRLLQSGLQYIAGVDEVGRGPLAGAVYAAAVMLGTENHILEIKDSKKLSHEQRVEISNQIKSKCIDFSVGIASVEEIDRLNILNATKLAMKRAIDGLRIKPQHILIDALELREVPIPQTAIVKGDDLSVSIGAASIIAKVERDRYMDELSSKYPRYGFERNKGYGTEEHIAAIKAYGVTEAHRKSFLKNII